ncbi:MAG: hypothetical protein OEQ53_15355, partial [Saprospiraceae bacterium]|nr:hypothetical protein [Saprospiraceae bacterium]
LEQIYDYDRDSLVWMYSSGKGLYMTKVGDSWAEMEIDREPYVVGGKYELLREVRKNLQITRAKSGTYPYIIDCLIDEEGKIIDINLSNTFYKYLDETILIAADVLKNRTLIPGLQNGRPVSVVLPLPLLLTIIAHQDGSRGDHQKHGY